MWQAPEQRRTRQKANRYKEMNCKNDHDTHNIRMIRDGGMKEVREARRETARRYPKPHEQLRNAAIKSKRRRHGDGILNMAVSFLIRRSPNLQTQHKDLGLLYSVLQRVSGPTWRCQSLQVGSHKRQRVRLCLPHPRRTR